MTGLSAKLPLPGHDRDPFLVITVTSAWPAQPLFPASASYWDEGAWTVLPSQPQGPGEAQQARARSALQEGRQLWALGAGSGSGEVAVGQAEGVEGRVA